MLVCACAHVGVSLWPVALAMAALRVPSPFTAEEMKLRRDPCLLYRTYHNRHQMMVSATGSVFPSVQRL